MSVEANSEIVEPDAPHTKGIVQEERDSESPTWDFSQERVFMETISNQRFNFFLIFYAAIVAGAINSNSKQVSICVIIFGILILLLFWYGLRIVFGKLRVSIDNYLYKVSLIQRSLSIKLTQNQTKKVTSTVSSILVVG